MSGGGGFSTLPFPPSCARKANAQLESKSEQKPKATKQRARPCARQPPAQPSPRRRLLCPRASPAQGENPKVRGAWACQEPRVLHRPLSGLDTGASSVLLPGPSCAGLCSPYLLVRRPKPVWTRHIPCGVYGMSGADPESDVRLIVISVRHGSPSSVGPSIQLALGGP